MTLTIPLTILDTVDSTSTFVQTGLKDGSLQSPCAVMAHQQSGGRGRMGRSWQSPAGNLYLTMAIPASGVDSTLIPLMPLMTALFLSEWMEQRLQIRVTVKWPNDVLWAGRKLCGILCESSFQNGQWGNLVIGIGLNLNLAPEAGAENLSTCLSEILGHSFDVEAEARSLLTYVGDHWPWGGAVTELLARLQRYGLEPGQLMCSTSGELVRYDGVNERGDLCLHEFQNPPLDHVISSANHGWRWVYQGTDRTHHPIIVVDIGNSRIKVGYFENADEHTPAWVRSCAHTEKELQKLLDEHLTDREVRGLSLVWPMHMTSVSPAGTELFTKVAAQLNLPWTIVPKRPVRLQADEYPLTQLGIDRLAAMEGILATAQDLSSCYVIVSAGTCITIDVVKDRRHHGGLILPGLTAALRALHDSTGLLPLIEVPGKSGVQGHTMTSGKEWLGRDTHSAMTQGILYPVIALIRTMVGQYQAETKDVQIVLLGGDGPSLSPYFPMAKYEPYLVMNGIKAMVTGG